jgi:dephospho-CoA kinase
MTRPASLDEAIRNRLTKQQHDPEQLARVADLAIDNPTAYADLPAAVRQAAALHATTAAEGGQR